MHPRAVRRPGGLRPELACVPPSVFLGAGRASLARRPARRNNAESPFPVRENLHGPISLAAARGAGLLAGRPGALAALHAAADWPVQRGPSHEPQPVRYDPKQWQSVPRPFLDDSAACILYSGISYLIEPDGTQEIISHEITRLAGRKAIEKLGEFRGISYDPSHQKLTLNEACIHKADGRVVAVEPQHLQLRDVSTDYQVYDHDKQLIISFPGLEVGDTIEVKWSLRGKNPEHAGQFFTRY